MFLKLTQNEFIKQFKKKSTIIVIIISILVGIGAVLIPKIIMDYEKKIYVDSYSIKTEYEQAKNRLKENNYSNENSGKISSYFSDKSLVETYDEFKKLNFDDKNQFEFSMFYKYQNLYLDAKYYEYIKNNKGNFTEEFKRNLNLDRKEDFLEYTDEQIEQSLKINLKQLEEILKNLKTTNYDFFYKFEVEASNEQIKSLNEDLKQKNITEKETDKIKSQITILEKQKELNEILMQQNIPPMNNSYWQNVAYLKLQNLIQNAFGTVGDEKEYEQNFRWEYKTYQEYVDAFNFKQKEALKKYDNDLYALKNNIPTPDMTSSARIGIFQALGTIVLIICILSAIVGGALVSKEFSTGTIRLLLIKPVKRYKVLLSKFVMLLISSFGFLLISFISTTITAGILYGFSDLGISVVSSNLGSPMVTPFFGVLASLLFIAFINVLFISSLAFAISTIFKNTALSVGLSCLLTASTPFTFVIFNSKGNLLNYLPTSYLNLVEVVNKTGMIGTFIEFRGIKLSPLYGMILLLCLSIILFTISIISFNKKEITN